MDIVSDRHDFWPVPPPGGVLAMGDPRGVPGVGLPAASRPDAMAFAFPCFRVPCSGTVEKRVAAPRLGAMACLMPLLRLYRVPPRLQGVPTISF